MIPDEETFKRDLRDAVVDALPDLCALFLRQMHTDAQNGWGYWYSFPLWIEKNAPPPHLNEQGLRYLIAALTMELFVDPETGITARPNPYAEQFRSERASRAGYRSQLEPGQPDLMAFSGSGHYLDEVVNDTANRLLAEQHRHVLYEVQHDFDRGYLDAIMSKGTLTAPPALCQHAPAAPVRNPERALDRDAPYWRAVYQVPTTIVYDMQANQDVQTKPDTTVALMAQLAPDFSYAPALGSASRLVFVDNGTGTLAWAVVIEKIDKAREYTYPPKLVLMTRALSKKLQSKNTLFTHVDILGGRHTPLWPREVEISILFHLQRIRELVRFYQPIVDKVRANGA